MKLIKRALNGIQCQSYRPSYQRIKAEVARMSGREDFRLIGLSEQAKNFGSALQGNVGLWAEKGSVNVKQSRFRGREQREIWSLLSSILTESRVKKTLLQIGRFRMPLRGHASPRRGRNPGGISINSPRRVSPLAFASPSSPGSDGSDSDTNNSVQTVKFKYIRRTKKPIVSTLITVVFTEEDDEDDKGKGISEELEPSSNNSSQSGSQEESSYQPSSQSKLEEESTAVHSEEQHEALHEICSLIDMDITSSAQHQETDSQAQTLPAEDKKPARFFGGRLYPILPPGILRLEDIPAGMEIECVPDPKREEAEWEAEQLAAKQKDEEEQATAEERKD